MALKIVGSWFQLISYKVNDIVGVEGGEEGRGGVERRERKGFGVWVRAYGLGLGVGVMI